MDRPRLIERVRARMRLKHMAPRTEVAYVQWMRRYFDYHRGRHPRDLGAADVENFLSMLAGQGRVAASTQNQALAAILFLYREVLKVDLDSLEGMVRAKRPKRLPIVLTRREICGLLAAHTGTTPWPR